MYKILKSCKEITRQELIFRTYVFLLANTLLTKRISACHELLVALCLYGSIFITIILLSVLFYGFQSYILIMYKALCVSAQAHLQQHWTFNQVAIRNSHCIQSKVSSALGMLTRKFFLFYFFFHLS